jgi:hypothetical protein
MRTADYLEQAGLKRLRGDKLTERLAELARTTNEHHQAATAAWRGALEHARKAGDALIEAYVRLGRRKKWSAWKRDNFPQISSRSLRVYKQVAKQWDNPLLIAARKVGMEPESIKAFLDIVQRKKNPASEAEQDAETTAAEREHEKLLIARQSVRDHFNAQLAKLKLDELDQIDRHFHHFWEPLHEKLKDFVRVNVREDFYAEDVQTYLEARARTRRICQKYNARPEVRRRCQQRTAHDA